METKSALAEHMHHTETMNNCDSIAGKEEKVIIHWLLKPQQPNSIGDTR